MITATHNHGKIESVEIVSEAGGPLRLHNPWPATEVPILRGVLPPLRSRDAVLTVLTKPGEQFILRPSRLPF